MKNKFFPILFCLLLFGCSFFSSVEKENLTPIKFPSKNNSVLTLQDYFSQESETQRKRACQLWMSRNCQHVFAGHTTCLIQKLNHQSEMKTCSENYVASCQNLNSKPEYCEPESDGEKFYSNTYRLNL